MRNARGSMMPSACVPLGDGFPKALQAALGVGRIKHGVLTAEHPQGDCLVDEGPCGAGGAEPAGTRSCVKCLDPPASRLSEAGPDTDRRARPVFRYQPAFTPL
ncbi:hypothetical protein [Streptomyces brevispora]|uniref:Uncharacterized protein n=2 Tax=Streptomyces brevispora TaxID=887462 RepID=A0ABZ1FWB1_9ACTN|nr:hypothetical protein [Streptomyces brevispora]WSC11790.1 hypothetical protein OIE64_02170 [Streptomyces brevispora]